MGTHKGLEALMKQDLAKVLKAQGLTDAQIKKELARKHMSMYAMLKEAFADKKVQASLKIMVPAGLSVSNDGDVLRITIQYGTADGYGRIHDEMAIKEAFLKAIKGKVGNAANISIEKVGKATHKCGCSCSSKKGKK